MRQRQDFTREFKLEAVRLVAEEGRPLAEVARELALRPDQLRRWRRQLEGRRAPGPQDAFPGSGHQPPLEEEVQRLRREVETLKLERDFLKRAAAYFAQGLRRGTP